MTALGLTNTLHAQETPAAAAPSEKLSIGVMGVNGRGGAIVKGMMASGQVDIAYICDVDERAAERVTKIVNEKQSTKTQSVKDFRRILDD